MRVQDWRERLHAQIDAARTRAAEWGVHDCLQFPALCIEAVTGINPASQFGEYSTELGAAKLMVEFGGVSGILTKAFGDPVAPNWARSGDVVVIDAPQSFTWIASAEGMSRTADLVETGAICNGNTVVFCGKPRGINFVPRELIKKAWRID